MTSLAPLLQAFFTDRLMTQRQASPHTIAAYHDTLRLLLEYVTARTGTAPSALQISDLDAPCITGFLTHLQQVRGNSVRTRNARLAAIHSLFGYAALRHPEHAAVIQRVKRGGDWHNPGTGITAEQVVGGRLHLRADLVRDGVHSVRHRRVLASHRGLARRSLDADLAAPGRTLHDPSACCRRLQPAHRNRMYAVA